MRLEMEAVRPPRRRLATVHRRSRLERHPTRPGLLPDVADIKRISQSFCRFPRRVSLPTDAINVSQRPDSVNVAPEPRSATLTQSNGCRCDSLCRPASARPGANAGLVFFRDVKEQRARSFRSPCIADKCPTPACGQSTSPSLAAGTAAGIAPARCIGEPSGPPSSARCTSGTRPSRCPPLRRDERIARGNRQSG